MNNFGEQLEAYSRRRREVMEYVAYVTAVDQSTGRVILDDGLDADCASGYLSRAVGDEVVVKVIGAGAVKRRIVMDRVGAEWQEQEVPPAPLVGAGTSLPEGAGWSEATKVWVREGGMSLYFQTAQAVPPTVSATDPATMSPTGWRVYRGASARTDATGPMQGDWGHGDHSTVWTYPSSLGAAIAARGAGARVSLHMTRRAGSGSYAPTPVMVRLHAHATLPISPQWQGLADQVGTLTSSGVAGETADLELTPAMVSALASGAALGVGLHGTSAAEYLIATPDSGALTITA